MGDRLREIAEAIGTLLLFLPMLVLGLAFWGVVVMVGLGLLGVIDLDTDTERPKPARAPVERTEESFCDPNYTGCVPDTGYDVDCKEVDGPVEVIGIDSNGLDSDGDLIACEWG
jgi:hypothetical protein